MMKILLILLFLPFSVTLFAQNTPILLEDGALRVAVASNFMSTAKKLAASYQSTTGRKLILSSGSTGKLTTQIRFGAPYDVFLAADQKHPQLLIDEGLAVQTNPQTYATGQLALITRTSVTSADEIAALMKPLQIAIANPKIAPYGAAGKAWLADYLPQPHPHQIVIGENINQTWHYFINGGVDVALVAYSQILTRQSLNYPYWVLETTPDALQQSAITLKATSRPLSAAHFLEYLQGSEALRIIEQSGYKRPD